MTDDEDGLPLGFVITPGEAHDATAYEELMDLDEDRPKALLADRGYDSDAIREDAWFVLAQNEPSHKEGDPRAA